MDDKEYVRDKLREYYENTIESGLKYNDSLTNINYFALQCKAAENNQLHTLLGNNICMFNYRDEKEDYVMILFSIPLNPSNEDNSKRSMSERVMEIIEQLEKCFVTIDNIKTEPVQEDKHIYITALKSVEQE